MKISVVSGGFDPVHSGHISYINSAANYGDKLIVALNSDAWLIKKKGKFFLPFEERKEILENLKNVDEVISFKDDDSGSVINALKSISSSYPNEQIIFCNGGDRTKKNIPEMSLTNIKFQFGVGGNNKLNSSSTILKKWNHQEEKRIWGSFFDIYANNNTKVKELNVLKGKGMSFQRHFKRNEIWFIKEGSCKVRYSKQDPKKVEEHKLKKHDTFFVKKGEWHQIINDTNKDCVIIEIQYGDATTEEDIERLYYYEKNESK